MKIAVTGSTGLVGTALVELLRGKGHDVLPIVRGGGAEGAVRWAPLAGEIDEGALVGADAVVHLAGDGVADGRWNDEKKRRILESRTKGTALLARTIAAMDVPPRVLVSASAVGFYGPRPGAELLDESSASGGGFLADVCRQWESAADPARDRTRVVHARFGVVLAREGGALRKMLLPFRMGLGGVLGSGDQVMSWIALEDAVRAILHAIDCEALRGAVNVVSPEPATNREFTKALGAALRRPTPFPMPAFAARLAFGEMADEMLLAGQRVAPKRLLESGFEFHRAKLADALSAILSR